MLAENVSDIYKSVKESHSEEIKVKGSRFIAEAHPVQDESEVETVITEIRKRAYNATHHCTAYRLGLEGNQFRYNDDGEPSGTAGPPILRQIDARALTNTLVVVTRYFGGTKLGTGGLIRAYGEAASCVLDACTVEEHIIRVSLRIRFVYDDTSPAMFTISQFDTRIMETRYSEHTEMLLGVRCSQARLFITAFTEALRGRGEADVV